MLNRPFRVCVDVLVEDRDRPHALPVPERLSVDIDAETPEQACELVGKYLGKMAKPRVTESYNDSPVWYAPDTAPTPPPLG
jgi:hypothetical protein